MVYWIFGTNTSCPSKAMQNGILSIIQAINKPNCWQEALIVYLVSENELSMPNQFRCLEIHRFFPLNWSKTGIKNTWFSKTKVILFFENLVTTIEHKWWCSDVDIRIFLPDAYIFLWFIFSFTSYFSKLYSKHVSLHILSGPPFFIYFYQRNLAYQKVR